MMLSDGDIEDAIERGDLYFSDLAPNAIQPASVDLRLARKMILPAIEPVEGGMYSTSRTFWLDEHNDSYIPPGNFVLGCTLEHVTVGPGLALKLEGKSSLGRLGLVIHATAGFIDPGFSGQITLEMSNIGHHSIALRAGMLIGQVNVFELKTPARRPYGHPELGSRYQGQQGPTISRPKAIPAG